MAVQVAQGQVVRLRRATAERWQAALQRAITLGLEVFVVADTRERMVTSASQLDTLHRTNGDFCTCAAGVAGDPICCHRAAVRFVQGRLRDASAAPANCESCSGGGVIWYRGFQERCGSCGGSGIRVERRLHDAPGIEIVARAA